MGSRGILVDVWDTMGHIIQGVPGTCGTRGKPIRGCSVYVGYFSGSCGIRGTPTQSPTWVCHGYLGLDEGVPLHMGHVGSQSRTASFAVLD